MNAAMERRNATTALLAASVAVGMIGLAYAAVPLYRLFCAVTGLGGTPQIAERAPDAPLPASAPVLAVRFDATTSAGLGWRFAPVERSVSLRAGEEKIAFYRASNPTRETITGTATFNVTPAKAGLYFNKIECFCFTEQTLAPGQSVDMPVSFFIDPRIAEDRDLRGLKEITLGYTFFRADGKPAPRRAKE